MCLPIKNQDGSVIGVLQLINKLEGAGIFDADDEEIMCTFLNIAAPILAQSSLYMQIQGKARKEDLKETGVGAVKTDKADVPKMAGFAEGDEEEEEVWSNNSNNELFNF